MRILIFLATIALLMQGCGDSSYIDNSSTNESSEVFQLPKADCGGDPCL